MASKIAATLSSTPYNRFQELKAFDETKAGVKGLVDKGVTQIPQIFVQPQEDRPDINIGHNTTISIPIIDLGSNDIIKEILEAAGTVGFFHVMNHGVPEELMERMMRGICAFMEESQDVKEPYYTRDRERRVRLECNLSLYVAKFANWRDTLRCIMGPDHLDPHLLPPVCREVILEYSECVEKLGDVLFGLLSEALGLERCYLNDLGCSAGRVILGNYYPRCPEPELTMGVVQHCDAGFLTVLLQDKIGGLQAFIKNQWVNVPCVPGALLINIGELMQIISNEKFRSIEHRALSSVEGPRVSVAYFFSPRQDDPAMVFGPIKELISEKMPQIYRDITVKDFYETYRLKGMDGKRVIHTFKL